MTKNIKKQSALLAAMLISSNAAWSESIRLGTNIWLGYEPLNILFEKNSESYGVELKSQRYWNATEVTDALLAGVINAAGLTLDEAIGASQRLDDLTVVAVLDQSNGADIICGQGDWEQYSEVRIALEDTALGAYFLSIFLSQYSYISDNVQISTVFAPVDEHEHLYRQNEADLFVTFDPFFTDLNRMGCEKVFDTSQSPEAIIDVLVIRGSDYNDPAMREGLRSLLQDWSSQVDDISSYINEHGQALAQGLGVAIDELPQMYDGILIPERIQNIEFIEGEFPHRIEEMHLWLVGQGIINDQPLALESTADFLR